MAVASSSIAACIAARSARFRTMGEAAVKEIKVYPAAAGGWIYEIWIAARPVVIGWCAQRETAEQKARLA